MRVSGSIKILEEYNERNTMWSLKGALMESDTLYHTL